MVYFYASIKRAYWAGWRVSKAVSKSNTFLLTLLVCISVLTSIIIVGFLAKYADDDANRLTAISISGALDRERSRISNEAYINAHWDDAFAHAYGSMNGPWIPSQWGTPIGIAYVIDSRGRSLFAHLPGGREPPLAQFVGSRTLKALLDRLPKNEAAVRQRGDATVLVGIASGTPALIAFSPIVRERGPTTLDRSSYRTFVDIRLLSQKLLDEWAKGFGLQDLRWLANGQTSDSDASTDVRDWSGTYIGTIAWKRLTPGSLAIREIMPIICLCFAFFFAVAAMIARRIHSLGQELIVQSQASLKAARQEREARILADTDGLTGLFNRRRFNADLEDTAVPANVDAMTVGLIDLDRFKAINDNFGHAFGDRLLAKIAQRLRDTAATDATLYRIGGDEFAMIIMLNAAKAFQLAEQMCTVVAAPTQIFGRQMSVGASIGLKAFVAAEQRPVELTERADHALYHAKREKPGHAVQSSPEIERQVNANHIAEAELNSAVFETK